MNSIQSPPPIVVDLDGTLTPCDTLQESLAILLRQRPWLMFLLPFWLLRGLAFFKARIAERFCLDPSSIPYREDLLAYLREQKQAGSVLILATASNEKVAAKIASHLGFFDGVLASDEKTNLKGEKKLQAIVRLLGERFVYAGDSIADLPIWDAAEGVILAGDTRTLRRALKHEAKVRREFPSSRLSFRDWLRFLRAHQWSKNLLVFIPLFTSFGFVSPGKLLLAAGAFLCFSLLASSTYLYNDLLDLQSDRAHKNKRFRILAAGRFPLVGAMLLGVTGLFLSLSGASMLSIGFLGMLLLYGLISLSYSYLFKRIVLLDVVVLSLLYTLRIIAGSVVIEVETSFWLLAFSVFVFYSLALSKRCSELISLTGTSKEGLAGRGYRVGDLRLLAPLGIASGMAGTVVFGLYVDDPTTQARYLHPVLLWGAIIVFMYWISRFWLKTLRGEMHTDPVLFAVRDKVSILSVLLIVLFAILARF